MTARGMFSKTDGWEREMPKDRSKLADLPDTEEGRPLECVSWVGSAIFSLFRCHLHLVPSP